MKSKKYVSEAIWKSDLNLQQKFVLLAMFEDQNICKWDCICFNDLLLLTSIQKFYLIKLVEKLLELDYVDCEYYRYECPIEENRYWLCSRVFDEYIEHLARSYERRVQSG